MFRDLSAVSTIRINAPKDAVLAVVWNIKGIETFEVKADHVNVLPIDERKGTYKVTGHFAGLPWRREFAYFLSDDGFYSRDAHLGPGPDITVQGGFIVQQTAEDECTLIHYEMYHLSPWFVPLKPLIAAYLKWSMRKELGDMKAAVMQTRMAA
ncbi:MAG: hypothetical protein ACXV5L_12615 [Thermoanaerobaculia bacterium]